MSKKSEGEITWPKHAHAQSLFWAVKTKQGALSHFRMLLSILLTRNVLLSAQMGEGASVVLICIITSRFEL